ncbi:response regulator [Actinokineospora globicatena]|uniref:response regulator n=1 Tax=Actinokineospora globicatena TaxID=103729 RepID=UPI0020A592C1|nr:response regulator [Actinokineospora globicatena]MCP2301500.1 Response regulator of citrate/malate metabolism [Actinokineospora globicatena]GLW76853.1 transcriptional regulatory protein [Actinokineospora globicatena]GLW83686.1 transcriptional regulatory protein [Actinokineospora globicatena]
MISVLVVDDDFMVARVHSGYIERTPGFTVAGVAHTGAQALALTARLRPDLVLLDIYLPDMGGLEVLRELRNGPAEPDVIVISAATDVDTIRGALRGGVLHYLVKPFAYTALYDQLRHFATVHTRLGELTSADQAAIDEVFGARPRSALPKGLTEQTATLVEQVLRAADPDMSAAECAAQAQLSRVSARRYLEHFVDSNRAEVRLRYGGTGRPERRYRLR